MIKCPIKQSIHSVRQLFSLLYGIKKPWGVQIYSSTCLLWCYWWVESNRIFKLLANTGIDHTGEFTVCELLVLGQIYHYLHRLWDVSLQFSLKDGKQNGQVDKIRRKLE